MPIFIFKFLFMSPSKMKIFPKIFGGNNFRFLRGSILRSGFLQAHRNYWIFNEVGGHSINQKVAIKSMRWVTPNSQEKNIIGFVAGMT